jgi:dTDP-4-dehydrorhamnose reductase
MALIGSQGMLGRDLMEFFRDRHDLVGLDIGEIDIRRREETIATVADLKAQLVINAAACVDVESCENDPQPAFRVNAVGSQNLAMAAERAGSEYLYFSSDYVFDGRSGRDYDELAAPNPVNQYGRSKLAGEVLARQVCRRSYIVRTAWLFGHREGNYVERVLNKADREGVVRMATDQLESPTYTLDLAQAVERLIETGAYGTYHVTSAGACTRLQFAAFVLQAAGRHEEVEEVEAARLKRQAERPCRTVLDCSLFEMVSGHPLPHWHEGVRRYLSNRPSRRAPQSDNSGRRP